MSTTAPTSTETVYAVTTAFKNITAYDFQIMDVWAYDTLEEAENVAAEIRADATSEVVAYVTTEERDTSNDEERIAEIKPGTYLAQDPIAWIRSHDLYDKTSEGELPRWIGENGNPDGPMAPRMQVELEKAGYVQGWIHESKLRRYGTVTEIGERVYESGMRSPYVTTRFDDGSTMEQHYPAEGEGGENYEAVMKANLPDGLPAVEARLRRRVEQSPPRERGGGFMTREEALNTVIAVQEREGGDEMSRRFDSLTVAAWPNASRAQPSPTSASRLPTMRAMRPTR